MWRRSGDFLLPNPAGLPSRTWASLDGPIMFYHKLRQEYDVRLVSPTGRPPHPIARINLRFSIANTLILSTPVIAARRGNIYPEAAGYEGRCFQTARPSFRLASMRARVRYSRLSNSEAGVCRACP